MKVTIITVYRANSADTYTAVVEGELTAEQRTDLASRLDLRSYEDDEMSDDIAGFVTLDVVKPEDLTKIHAAFPDETTIAGTEPG
jgi:hypothetical protein